MNTCRSHRHPTLTFLFVCLLVLHFSQNKSTDSDRAKSTDILKDKYAEKNAATGKRLLMKPQDSTVGSTSDDKSSNRINHDESAKYSNRANDQRANGLSDKISADGYSESESRFTRSSGKTSDDELIGSENIPQNNIREGIISNAVSQDKVKNAEEANDKHRSFGNVEADDGSGSSDRHRLATAQAPSDSQGLDDSGSVDSGSSSSHASGNGLKSVKQDTGRVVSSELVTDQAGHTTDETGIADRSGHVEGGIDGQESNAEGHQKMGFSESGSNTGAAATANNDDVPLMLDNSGSTTSNHNTRAVDNTNPVESRDNENSITDTNSEQNPPTLSSASQQLRNPSSEDMTKSLDIQTTDINQNTGAAFGTDAGMDSGSKLGTIVNQSSLSTGNKQGMGIEQGSDPTQDLETNNGGTQGVDSARRTVVGQDGSIWSGSGTTARADAEHNEGTESRTASTASDDESVTDMPVEVSDDEPREERSADDSSASVHGTADDNIVDSSGSDKSVEKTIPSGSIVNENLTSGNAENKDSGNMSIANGGGDDDIKVDTKHQVLPSFDEWRQKEQEKHKSLEAQQQLTQPVVGQIKPKAAPRKQINYAAVTCGAKVVANNPEAQNAVFVLFENRDQYMINPCKAKKVFTVELCESVQVQTIELGNLELFSSLPERFDVHASDRHPTKEWRLLGSFKARDERIIQSFPVTATALNSFFAKYIRIEIHSHYGNEHYCPLSILRVNGVTVDDDDDVDEREVMGGGILLDEELLNAETEVSSKNLFSSATDTVLSLVKTVLNPIGSSSSETSSNGSTTLTDANSGTPEPSVPPTDPIQPSVPPFSSDDRVISNSESFNSSATSNRVQPLQNGKTYPNVSIQSTGGGMSSPNRDSKFHWRQLVSGPHCDSKLVADDDQLTSAGDSGSCKTSASRTVGQAQRTTGKTWLPRITSNYCADCLLCLPYTAPDTASGCRWEKSSPCNFFLSAVGPRTRCVEMCKPRQQTRSKNYIAGQHGCTNERRTQGGGMRLGYRTSGTEELSGDACRSGRGCGNGKAVVDGWGEETDRVREGQMEEISGQDFRGLESCADGNGQSSSPCVATGEDEAGSGVPDPSEKSSDGGLVNSNAGSVQQQQQVETGPVVDVVQDVHSTVQETLDSRAAGSFVTGDNFVVKDPQIPDQSSSAGNVPVDSVSHSEATGAGKVSPDHVITGGTDSAMSPDIGHTSVSEIDPSAQVSPESHASGLGSHGTPGVPSGSAGPGDVSSTEPVTAVPLPAESLVVSPEQESLDFDDVPYQKLTSRTKESIFVKLKNRIKDLEINLNLSNRYLEELSQRYKVQMDEMYTSLNKTIAKLSVTARSVDEKDQRQTDRVTNVETTVAHLSEAVISIQSMLESFQYQMVERHVYLMATEFAIFLLIASLLSYRGFRRSHYAPAVCSTPAPSGASHHRQITETLAQCQVMKLSAEPIDDDAGMDSLCRAPDGVRCDSTERRAREEGLKDSMLYGVSDSLEGGVRNAGEEESIVCGARDVPRRGSSESRTTGGAMENLEWRVCPIHGVGRDSVEARSIDKSFEIEAHEQRHVRGGSVEERESDKRVSWMNEEEACWKSGMRGGSVGDTESDCMRLYASNMEACGVRQRYVEGQVEACNQRRMSPTLHPLISPSLQQQLSKNQQDKQLLQQQQTFPRHRRYSQILEQDRLRFDYSPTIRSGSESDLSVIEQNIPDFLSDLLPQPRPANSCCPTAVCDSAVAEAAATTSCDGSQSAAEPTTDVETRKKRKKKRCSLRRNSSSALKGLSVSGTLGIVNEESCVVGGALMADGAVNQPNGYSTVGRRSSEGILWSSSVSQLMRSKRSECLAENEGSVRLEVCDKADQSRVCGGLTISERLCSGSASRSSPAAGSIAISSRSSPAAGSIAISDTNGCRKSADTENVELVCSRDSSFLVSPFSKAGSNSVCSVLSTKAVTAYTTSTDGSCCTSVGSFSCCFSSGSMLSDSDCVMPCNDVIPLVTCNSNSVTSCNATYATSSGKSSGTSCNGSDMCSANGHSETGSGYDIEENFSFVSGLVEGDRLSERDCLKSDKSGIPAEKISLPTNLSLNGNDNSYFVGTGLNKNKGTQDGIEEISWGSEPTCVGKQLVDESAYGCEKCGDSANTCR